MNKLLKPEEYEPKMRSLRERNKYAANWTLRIVRKTNRHPETSGHYWGWYEVFPLEIIVGYWGSEKDDMAGFDIKKWNEDAERRNSERNDKSV